MTKLIILGVAVFVAGILFQFFKSSEKEDKKYEPLKYNYTRQKFLISRAEHECYDALVLTVGDKYHVFPQVHLPQILDHKIVGQNWKGALSHINQKSVDFVLCDKAYISPVLAIELDDKSHEKKDRIERDIEVERMLENAKVPLLRLENHGSFNSKELAEKINSVLVSKN